ncbi:MAG: FAD-binding protein, partial [Nitrosomonas sp.]|nr:FAD-binding protein [Nitrosomonas sp.]
MQTHVDHFKDTICFAAEHKNPIELRGGGTKDFYGNRLAGQQHKSLDLTVYSGLIDYEPAELVVTARTGTRLVDLEAALNNNGQMLAFEPPNFGSAATLGGCVA